MEDIKEKTADVILTPIYNEEIYKYHECSNCKKEIYFEEDIFKPFHFKENITYCPFCGGQVIRYAKPQYIKNISWDWLEKYQNVIESMYRQLEYEIHCKLNKEQIRELENKAERGIEYFKSDKWQFPYSNRVTCEIVYKITREKIHYTNKQKLEKEFGDE